MVQAICEHEGEPEFVTKYINTRNHTSAGRERTDQPECPTCHQAIYRDIIRDYSGDEGYRQAIYDCCTSKQAKAKYAAIVAERIVSIEDDTRKIPPKVAELFEKMQPIMSDERRPNIETISETATDSQP